MVKKCIVLLLIFTCIQLYHCRRYGGGRGGSYGSFPTPRRISPHGTTPRRISPHGMTTPRSHGVSTRRHTTSRSTGGGTSHGSTPSSAGWNLPPRPGQPGGHYKPSNVKIKNEYNYNYPGYVGVPQQSHYPGYYQPSTNYQYSSHDTGNTALGFFLGYGLAKLTTPTFTHQSLYDGYVPRYDHYTVHHYYHGKDSVPKQQEIPANTLVGCVGDTSTVCPGNTTTICTSNGALMCVVSATSTVPCSDNRKVNCVKSIISCVNNTAPECKNSNQNTTSISIPCVSNAKIYGDLKYVNNTIVPSNFTDSTNNIASNNTITANSTMATNNTTSNTTESTTTMHFSTQYPITTTPVTSTSTTVKEEKKEPQNFCIAVIALPAKREPTKGEIALQDAQNIISKFMEKVWGL